VEGLPYLTRRFLIPNGEAFGTGSFEKEFPSNLSDMEIGNEGSPFHWSTWDVPVSI